MKAASGIAPNSSVNALFPVTTDTKAQNLPHGIFRASESFAYRRAVNGPGALPEDPALETITIPPKAVNELPDPDGHSECVIRSPTQLKIFNAPGFPSPVPKLAGPPSYEVKETLNMGLGVFATRDIKRGELIFAERPLLVSPRILGWVGASSASTEDIEAARTRTVQEWEKRLEVAVDRMTEEDQTAFRSLANSHTEDGSGPLLGISRTNGYGVQNLFDAERLTVLSIYSGIGKIGSRINHSCMPTVVQNFSIPSFCLLFSAEVDIKAGDQLFVSYCPLQQTKAERQANLAHHGFMCSCLACTHATPESDTLRKELSQRIRFHLSKMLPWLCPPPGSRPRRIAESVLDPVLELREAMIKEGLHATAEYKVLVGIIQRGYEKIGSEKARRFREEFATFGEAELPWNSTRQHV